MTTEFFRDEGAAQADAGRDECCGPFTACDERIEWLAEWAYALAKDPSWIAAQAKKIRNEYGRE